MDVPCVYSCMYEYVYYICLRYYQETIRIYMLIDIFSRTNNNYPYSHAFCLGE